MQRGFTPGAGQLVNRLHIDVENGLNAGCAEGAEVPIFCVT